MFFKYLWGSIPNLFSALVTSQRRRQRNGGANMLTLVGVLGISLIAMGALVACPTDDNEDDSGGSAAMPVFTFEPDETAYRFDIDEGSYTTGSPGIVGTVSASDATHYTISGTGVTLFSITPGTPTDPPTLSPSGTITATSPLDFETTPSYTLTATAHNGAGADAPSATETVTITVTDVSAGLASIAAYEVTVGEDGTFVADATDRRQSLSGSNLSLGPLSTVDDFDPTTFTISPSSPFTLTKAAGLASEAMLMASAADLDYETLPVRGDGTRGYTLTVSATEATNSNTITLNVTVTDVVYVTADDLTVREDAGTLALMLSAVDSTTGYTVAGIRSVDTPNTPFSVAAGPPLPTALTIEDNTQLDVEDDTTPDSYSDLVITIEIDGGDLTLVNDVETITVGMISVTGIPGFVTNPPTIFVDYNGNFVRVGTTEITIAATLDLAETSEFTLVKGDFVPTSVTLGTVAATTGGGARFAIERDTELRVSNLDVGSDHSYRVEVSADGMANDMPITGATATLMVEIIEFYNGAAAAPWRIDSVAQLQSIDSGFVNGYTMDNGITLTRAKSLADHYLLTADLDMANDADAIANFDPIGDCGGAGCTKTDDNVPFTGGFDGGGHTIANLTINRPSLWGVGLFALIDGADVGNLALTGVDVTGFHSVGGLAGAVIEGSVERIVVSGSLVGQNSVGLVSGLIFGMITQSLAIGEISPAFGAANAGLLGGSCSPSPIENSYAVGRVTGSIIAGLCATTINTFVNSYVSASLTSRESLGNFMLGAFSGDGVPTFRNVYWDSDPNQIDVGNSPLPSDDRPLDTKQAVGASTDEPDGTTAKTGAELRALTGASAGTTNGSGWQEQFDIDNADSDANLDTGVDLASVRCDSDGDGVVEASDDYIWDFGSTSEYPALNCMPLTPAEQRTLMAQFPPDVEPLGVSLTVTDGAEGSPPTDALFTLQLTGAPSQDATVTYTLSGIAGTDYAAFGTADTDSRLEGTGVTATLSNTATSTFTITRPHVNVGTTIRLVPVDDVDTDNETITLTLHSITFADGGSGTITAIGALSLTIIDDD